MGEEASSQSHLGGIWEPSGDIFEPSGSNWEPSGTIWEACGSHLGIIWEAWAAKAVPR